MSPDLIISISIIICSVVLPSAGPVLIEMTFVINKIELNFVCLHVLHQMLDYLHTIWVGLSKTGI